MRKFRVLPLVLAVSLAGQAQAADLISIARDALVNNADLAASRSGYSSVQAGEDIERGDLLPQVSATGGVTRYNITSSQRSNLAGIGAGAGGGAGGIASGGSDNHYTGTTVQVQATQALFDATNWYQLEASKRQTAQEALNLRVDRQQLLYNVAQAYFDVLRAKEQLDTLRAEEQAVSRQLEQVRQQFDVGIVAATDVYEAQASYDLTRSQRISQESTLQVNFEALEQLTGKQYSSIDGLADDMPIERPTPASQQAWVEMASSQNLNLLAARAAVEVARANLDTSRAGHLPTLSAFANYQYGDSDQDTLRGHNEQNQIGLEATIPIYTGGSTSAQVRQSTYSLEQTQYQQESQLRTAVQQVRSYYAQTLNNVLMVQAQKRSIESNRSALEATRNGYEVGTRNIVDVLQAQQNLFTAISNYADARYDYVLNLLSLRQEAGILDVDTLQVLNSWLRSDKAVLLNFESQGTTGLGIGDDQPDPGMNGPSPLEGSQGQRRLPPPNRTALPDDNDLNGLGRNGLGRGMPGDIGY
ncbi:TolC family outer membrane protein [Kushneria konosiri]|uniref:Type I secretion protein TolC n=1 Tax=Kushneria konosiri TaxID=698828 RepID=A0A2Z2H903_9GAMM|nr:TolC family outer membrane protein [Kushneria konosiri]ARS51780.1 type I secretion protein TolC [Kushneria konosiri]